MRSAPGPACGYRSARRSRSVDTNAIYDAIFRFTGRRSVLGADTVGDHVSEAPPGRGEAYRTLAARSGTMDSLRLYLDGSSEATQLSLGLYADAGGSPGALLGAGSAATAQAGAWNEVELGQPVKVAAGRSYWIGLLNPAGSEGALRWRDRAGGSGGGEETSRADDLTALPATWSTGETWSDGPLSAYGLAPAPPPPDSGVDVEPGRLAFAATAGGAAPAPQSLVVRANNGGCAPCHWEVSVDAPWLSVSDSRGRLADRGVRVGRHDELNPGIYRTSVVVDRGAASTGRRSRSCSRSSRTAEHLVGAWSFDEAGGSTTADLSGHGNDGDIDGAQHTTVGVYGGALAFDSASGRGDVPDSDSLRRDRRRDDRGLGAAEHALRALRRPLALKPGGTTRPSRLRGRPGGPPSGHVRPTTRASLAAPRRSRRRPRGRISR